MKPVGYVRSGIVESNQQLFDLIAQMATKKSDTFSVPVYADIPNKDCRTCIYHGHSLSGITKLDPMETTDDSITLKVNQAMVCKNVSEDKCVDGSKYAISNPVQLYKLGLTQPSKNKEIEYGNE
jgi:hypothetical protein